MYYSYHNKIKKLIRDGRLVRYEFVERYKSISPCLVLYFDIPEKSPLPVPMPVREYRFAEYAELLKKVF